MSYYTEYSKGKMPLRYLVFANHPRYPMWKQIGFLLLVLVGFLTIMVLLSHWGWYVILLSYLFLVIASFAMKSKYEKIGFLDVDEGRLWVLRGNGEMRLSADDISSLSLTKKEVRRNHHVETYMMRCSTIRNEIHEIHVKSTAFLEMHPPHFHSTPPPLAVVIKHFTKENQLRYSIKS